MPRDLVPLTLVARRFSSFDYRSAMPLVAALAAHLAIALVVRVLPTGARPTGPTPTREEVVDIAFDVTTTPREEALPAPVPPAAIATVSPRRIEAVARESVGASTIAPGGATIDNAPAAPEHGSEPAAGAGAGWFRPNAVVDLRLGAGGHAAGALPDRPAQEPRGPSRSTTGGLAEGLDAEDFARGMGRGGPVLAAVHDAAHSGDAPMVGTATFSIVIGADGKVNVDVAAASGDRTAWEGLRPAIRTALLAGKPIRIAPKTRGLRVTVHVEASERFPGGGEPTPQSKQGAAVHGSVGKITETKDHVAIELPSVALTYQSRSCGGGIVLSPAGVSAGAGCNPGVAMRLVEARIVREERL